MSILSVEVEPQSFIETTERQLWSKHRFNVKSPFELPFSLYHLLSVHFYTVTLQQSQSMYFTLPDPLVKSFSRLFSFRKLLLTAHPCSLLLLTVPLFTFPLKSAHACACRNTYVMLTIPIPEITGSKPRIDIFPRYCLTL